MPDQTAKTCIICGVDCSHKPRVKDASGQYACRECAAAKGLLAVAAAPSPAQQVSPPRNEPGPLDFEPLLEPHPELQGAAPPRVDEFVLEKRPSNEGPIPIAEEPEPEIHTGPRPCPACLRPMPGGAVLCVLCGYDARKGYQIGTGVGAGVIATGMLTCPHCGYDMKGLKTPVCPECGKHVSRAAAKDVGKARKEAAQVRMMYVLPSVMFVAGVGVSAMILGASGREDMIPAHLVILTAKIVIAFTVYFLCGIAWIGFDAPLHVQAVRIAGVVAVTYVLLMLIKVSPLGRGGFYLWGVYAIVGAIYAWLLATMLDIDLEDAWLVAVLMYLAQMVVTMVLWTMMV